MTDRLLTARIVAERLGVCVETVLVWIRNGKLQAIRLPSGQIRVSEAQLDAHLEEWATPARGLRTTTADATQDGRYSGLPSIVRTTKPRVTTANEDEE